MVLPEELTTCNICKNRFSWNTDSENQPNLINSRLPVQSQACEHYFCYSCIVSCHVSELEKTNRARIWIRCMICKKEKAFRSDQPILYRAIITLGTLRIDDGNDEQDIIAHLGANLEETSLIYNSSEDKFKVKADTASIDSESVPVCEKTVFETICDAVENVATRSLVYDMLDSQEASVDVVRSPYRISDPLSNFSLKREATSIVGNNSGEASKRVRCASGASIASVAEVEDISIQVNYCIVNYLEKKL